MEQVELQRRDFKRLGVMGDWDRPYLTMAPKFEAEQIRALGKVIENGHLYIGAKPVYWCLDCRSALAEAEVEYEDKTSPAIDVAFRVADRGGSRATHRRAGRTRRCPRSVVIWTTTPWTLPANEAVALRADFEYVLRARSTRQGASQRVMLAEGLAAACLARYGATASRELARFKGRALEGLRLQHPFQPTRGARDPRRPRDARGRHRRRAHRARPWPGRLHRRPPLQPARGEPGAAAMAGSSRIRRWSAA